MLVVSARDFRASQSKFLDMAARGEDIVLKSRGRGSFRLVPVGEGRAPLQGAEAELEGALRQARDHMDGKIRLRRAEDLLDEIRDYGH